MVLPVGAADPARLQAACDEIRAEIDAETGWAAMPVDMPPAPPGAPADPGRYAVAAGPDRYEAIARVTVRRRHARIGLVAVRADRRRRGIGRALLLAVLADLRRAGIEAASADVDEANPAATALAESVGGRRVSSLVELVAR
ncbi:Acetyltransferase (GNAT) family protein [Pseudonocardia thermophila]|uniref:Acetyltransferase (GNAT) family protein n=1 Tax=Pseudonocardia thermophila TaxID=1848 RepID=A0A1M6Q8Q5_PSETH|nr:GNAT family N-acetyltransferase [Pseudonocardia thermophila]SHK16538.1 Acetyltransferase (GNAT) family protein [Pseudonocardia thermophila]